MSGSKHVILLSLLCTVPCSHVASCSAASDGDLVLLWRSAAIRRDRQVILEPLQQFHPWDDGLTGEVADYIM